MKLRNVLLPAGMAVFMAACAMPPSSSYYSDYDQPYDEQPYADDIFDYRGTPSYEGYYYERIIFLGNIPYYVDDYRIIRPLPPYLYDHFRRYPYNTFGPPVFSRNKGMRDGYPLASIIYLNGVPYNVGNDRIARPLPERLQPHFRYPSSKHGNDPRYGNHTPPYGQHDNGRNYDPAFNGHDPDSNPYRNEHGMSSPYREQAEPFGSTQGKGGTDTPADTRYRTTPTDSHDQPMRQTPSNASESHPDNANSTKTDKQKSYKQDNQGDSTPADDGSDNGSSKKSRDGSDDDQGNNDRGYSNKRD